MKAKLRKTGEIIDVVSYSSATYQRMPEIDYVCYIDEKGNEILGQGLNWIWDIEFLDDDAKVTTDWQSFRKEAAMRAMQGMLANTDVQWGEDVKEIAVVAVKAADALIEELKK